MLRSREHISFEEDFEYIDENDENDENELSNSKVKRRMRREKKGGKVALLMKRLQALQCENDLMATLCGFAEHGYIVRAASKIQAATRGWILRKNKRTLDGVASVYIRYCKVFLARRSLMRKKRAILLLQSRARGIFARRTPVARAIACMAQYREDVMKLEVLTLRLTSMICDSASLPMAQLQ